MVNMTQDRFDECVNGTQLKIPSPLTFTENLKACSKPSDEPTKEPAEDEPVKEESETNAV
jgi:hypothetical protein